MTLIVDANIVFSVLIKGQFTLELIYLLKSAGHELISCKEILDEISDNRAKILKYSSFKEPELSFIMELLFNHLIKVVPFNEYNSYIHDARGICSDKDDVPYVAMALKVKGTIWTNDKGLCEDCRKVGIGVKTTEEIKALLLS
jgi:predicted nucleic acid-binding protein